MHEIKLVGLNKFGESLPTNEIRVVTHAAAAKDTGENSPNDMDNNRKKVIEDTDKNDTSLAPSLRRCCTDHGVKNEACLKQLCEPFIIEPVDVEESIMCMKYMNTSYKCIDEIRDNIDYELVTNQTHHHCYCHCGQSIHFSPNLFLT